MKFEKYVLAIYCDNEHAFRDFGTSSRIYDKTGRAARKQARKAGWKLGKGGKSDLCPGCHRTWLTDRKASRDKKLKENNEC